MEGAPDAAVGYGVGEVGAASPNGMEPDPTAVPPEPDLDAAAAAPAALDREGMRQLILARLQDGEITQDEVLADMYASIYWIEQTVRPRVAVLLDQFAAFTGSPIGQRLGRRVIRKAAKEQARIEAEDQEVDQ